MRRRHHVMVRLSDLEAARLDELRGAQSRAVYMRMLLKEPPREDEIATRGEALAVLTGLARSGSVGAAVALERALREQNVEDGGELARWLRGDEWPTKRDRVPLADVESVAMEWAREKVDVVVYDPRFAEGIAQNLKGRRVPVKPWVFKRNAAAAAAFLEIIKGGRLRHGGADLPRRHALAAEVRDREYGQVVSKMKSSAHTDALMAALYAVAELAAMKERRVIVYEDRDLMSA